jgi:hypothetical protein
MPTLRDIWVEGDGSLTVLVDEDDGSVSRLEGGRVTGVHQEIPEGVEQSALKIQQVREVPPGEGLPFLPEGYGASLGRTSGAIEFEGDIEITEEGRALFDRLKR